MSKNKTKHVLALAVFILVQAFFLVADFSLIKLGIVGFGVIYLALTTVFSRHSDDTEVCHKLGNKLGVTAFVTLGCYFCDFLTPYFAIKSSGTDLLMEGFSDNLEIMMDDLNFSFLSIAMVVVFFIIKRNQSHPLLARLASYLFTFSLLRIFLVPLCDSWAVTGIILTVAVLFLACDVAEHKHSGFMSNAGKRWFNILCILLTVGMLFAPQAVQVFSLEGYSRYFFIQKHFRWYTALYLAVVMFLAAVAMHLVDNKAKTGRKVYAYPDAFLFWTAGWTFIGLYVLSHFHVGYWWALVLLYTAGIGYTLAKVMPAKPYANAGIKTYLYPLIITAVIISLTLAGYNSRLLVSIVFLAGFGLTYLVWKKHGFDNANWKMKATVYIAALLWIALTALVGLCCFRRLGYSFGVLAGLFAVSAVFICFLCYDSGLRERPGYIPHLAVVAVFAIVCLCLTGAAGTKISVEQKNGILEEIEVKANGRGNDTESVTVYWTPDCLDITKGLFDAEEETELDGDELPTGNGRLRVVAEDSHGVVTEEIFWIQAPNDYSEVEKLITTVVVP